MKYKYILQIIVCNTSHMKRFHDNRGQLCALWVIEHLLAFYAHLSFKFLQHIKHDWIWYFYVILHFYMNISLVLMDQLWDQPTRVLMLNENILYVYCFNNFFLLDLILGIKYLIIIIALPKVYYKTDFFPWIIIIINTCESDEIHLV